MNINQSAPWRIEIIRDSIRRGRFRTVLFDFDGTISLIREGWQDIMIPYFTEVLLDTPGAGDREELAGCAREFVDRLTGKQTIYQCIYLAEEVARRGGKAQDPLMYKQEYHRRLMERIVGRREGLLSGAIRPADMAVPGSLEFLSLLRDAGVTLVLASGTDEHYVREEAGLLGITEYFDGGIHGARDDYKLFSKAMVIGRILEEQKLGGDELAGFGDGYVEIENLKSAGGLAVGVATNESARCGIDEWKRSRLIGAGADAIIPDFSDPRALMDYLFPREV